MVTTISFNNSISKLLIFFPFSDYSYFFGFLSDSVKKKENLFIRHDMLGFSNTGGFQNVEKPMKKIIDPLAPFKIEINIPLSKIITDIDLPCNQEKEVFDPTKGIIEKKAHKIIRARRRKMKVHRFKKWLKKFKAQLLKKKVNEEMRILRERRVNK